MCSVIGYNSYPPIQKCWICPPQHTHTPDEVFLIQLGSAPGHSVGIKRRKGTHSQNPTPMSQSSLTGPGFSCLTFFSHFKPGFIGKQHLDHDPLGIKQTILMGCKQFNRVEVLALWTRSKSYLSVFYDLHANEKCRANNANNTIS